MISSVVSWVILFWLLPYSLGHLFDFNLNLNRPKLSFQGKSLYFANSINALVFLPLWSSLAVTAGLTSVSYLRIGQLMVQLFALVPGALMPAYFLKLRLSDPHHQEYPLETKSRFLLDFYDCLDNWPPPVLSLYFFIDKFLTVLVFGEQFAGSILTTRLFLLSSIFDSVAGFYQTFCLASEISTIYLLAQLLPSLSIVILALFLSPFISLQSFLAFKILASFLPLLIYLISFAKHIKQSIGNLSISASLCIAAWFSFFWVTFYIIRLWLCFFGVSSIAFKCLASKITGWHRFSGRK